jgi:general secretion pathway protein G
MMRRKGFTLIEMLVVMAIMATLLAIAAPRYFESMERAKDAALKADLRVLREAIDKFHADTGAWPKRLDDLTVNRYVRDIPVDPVTDLATTWLPQPNPDAVTPGIYDVRSGAAGLARDGTAYSSW